MLRFVQVNTAKNLPVVEASEALTRGMAVTLAVSTGKVGKATATSGVGFVEAVPNYDGINAVLTPTDGDFESIASGDTCVFVPTYPGEVYATNQITSTGLSKGDALEMSAGKFIKKGSSTTAATCWTYGGAYDDPSVTGMHLVVRDA